MLINLRSTVSWNLSLTSSMAHATIKRQSSKTRPATDHLQAPNPRQSYLPLNLLQPRSHPDNLKSTFSQNIICLRYPWLSTRDAIGVWWWPSSHRNGEPDGDRDLGESRLSLKDSSTELTSLSLMKWHIFEEQVSFVFQWSFVSATLQRQWPNTGINWSFSSIFNVTHLPGLFSFFCIPRFLLIAL